MQDALMNCEEYLVRIMVGGLGGKEIVEKTDSTQWELLISYTGCPNISERVSYMLERATNEVLIAGWIGTPLIKQLRDLKSKGIDIKAITHKPSDARNEPFLQEVNKGYQELINIIGLENISTKQEMHGRAIIVDNKAIIGSMDTTSDSLTGPHIEFAIYTDDVDTVRKIRAYFKSIFTPLKTP
jgi:phosphatidylserine/phosphatidylglycerophosphate/cardiolipin synthase-like enzyme